MPSVDESSHLNQSGVEDLIEPWLTDDSHIIEDRGGKLNGWRLLRDYKLDELLDHLRDQSMVANQSSMTFSSEDKSFKLRNIKSNNFSLLVWLLLVFSLTMFSLQLSQVTKLEMAEKRGLDNSLDIQLLKTQLLEYERYIENLAKQVSALSLEVSNSLISNLEMKHDLGKMQKSSELKIQDLQKKVDQYSIMEERVEKAEIFNSQIVSIIRALKRQVDYIWSEGQGNFTMLLGRVESLQNEIKSLEKQENSLILEIEEPFENYAQHIIPLNCTHYYPSFLHRIDRSLSSPSYENLLRPSKLLGESFAFDTSKRPCILQFEVSHPLIRGQLEVAHHLASSNLDNIPQNYSWETWGESGWERIYETVFEFRKENGGRHLVDFELFNASTLFRLVLQRTPSLKYVNLYTARILAKPSDVE